MRLPRALPEERGFAPGGLGQVDRVVEEAVEARAFPGAVLAVARGGALVHLRPFGRHAYEPGSPRVGEDAIYDLASLTKVVATTTVAMSLCDEGRLGLEQRVADLVPGFSGGAKDRVTVSHLLSHSSGLDWWAPLYRELRSPEAYVRRVVASDLAYEPGSRSVYSDLGFILLGEVVERAGGEPLRSLVDRRVLRPLGMAETTYLPGPTLLPRIPPTEQDPWRGRLLRGEVHDENAHAMGGVAPHAGLFGTAEDLVRLAVALLAGGRLGDGCLARAETVERFTRRAGVPGSTRALGWDTPGEASSAGELMSPRSFGHTGFTGTSLWADPERGLAVVLLTNRVHPSRENQAIRRVRPAVADAVVRALEVP